MIPGQIFTLIVGEDGIDGEYENTTLNYFVQGEPGTDGTNTNILLNGDELLSVIGGGGGIAGGPHPTCSSCAPTGIPIDGAPGYANYSLGTGVLNLQTAIGQGLYNLDGSNKIRIEY